MSRRERLFEGILIAVILAVVFTVQVFGGTGQDKLGVGKWRLRLSADEVIAESIFTVQDSFKIGAYWVTAADGSNGQVLKTNGSGYVSWQNDATGGGGTDSSFLTCSTSAIYPFPGHDTTLIGNDGDTARFRGYGEFYNHAIMAGTLEIPHGTTVPPVCNPGDLFFETDAKELNICSSTNVWRILHTYNGWGLDIDGDSLVVFFSDLHDSFPTRGDTIHYAQRTDTAFGANHSTTPGVAPDPGHIHIETDAKVFRFCAVDDAWQKVYGLYGWGLTEDSDSLIADTTKLKDVFYSQGEVDDSLANQVSEGEASVITIGMLDAGNSPVDEYVLTYESDDPTKFYWQQDQTGGGADSSFVTCSTHVLAPYPGEDTVQVGTTNDTIRARAEFEFYDDIDVGTWDANLSTTLWSEITQDSAAKQAGDTATALRTELKGVIGDTADDLRAEMPDSAKAHCYDTEGELTAVLDDDYVEPAEAEVITEVMLDCQNTPTDEWALTWESDGGGQFQWKDLTPAGADSEFATLQTKSLRHYTGEDTFQLGIDSDDTVRVRAVAEFFETINTGTWNANLSTTLWSEITQDSAAKQAGDTATVLRAEWEGAIGDTADDLRTELKGAIGDTANDLRAEMLDSAAVVCGDSMQVVWDSLAHYPDTVAFYDSLDNQVSEGEAEVITEPMLDAANSPTDEWALTWETDGGGKFEWKNISGGTGDSSWVQIEVTEILPYTGEDTTKIGADADDTVRVYAVLEADSVQAVKMHSSDSTVGANVHATTNLSCVNDVSVGDDIWVAQEGVIWFDSPGTEAYIQYMTGDKFRVAADGIGSEMEFLTTGDFRFVDEGTPGDTLLELNADGTVRFAESFTFPAADGSDGQVLKTNGSGVVTWQNDALGGGADSGFVTCSTSILVPYADQDTLQIGSSTADTARVRGMAEFYGNVVMAADDSIDLTAGQCQVSLKDNEATALMFKEEPGGLQYLFFETTNGGEKVNVVQKLYINSAYYFTQSDGSSGDVLQTNGLGLASWQQLTLAHIDGGTAPSGQAYNYGDAKLEIPNAADPAPTLQGQISLDETDDVLTIHDGSSEKVYAHSTFHFSATIADDGDFTDDTLTIWQAPKDMAVTLTEVRATVYGGTSVTYNIQERAWASLGSAGTNIYSSNQDADTNGEIETSFSNAGIAAAAHLVFIGAAESGDVQFITFLGSYTKDVE